MYLSKSKYCNAIQCNKILWLDTYKKEARDEQSNSSVLDNGTEAMNSFANLSNLSTEEKTIIRKNLLKYCELDTYAMVKIWEKLQRIINNK